MNRKISPWVWISLLFLVLTIVFGYKYFDLKEKAKENEVGVVSESPVSEEAIIVDDNDLKIEIMSSTSKPIRIIKYKPSSTLTLSQIASRHNCTVAYLKSINPGLKNKPSNYKVLKGKNINVPKKETPVSKPVPSPPSSSSLSAYQVEVVNLTNKERSKSGLTALKADDENLNNSAHAKSVDMDKHNYFSHNSPSYGSPFDMMKKFGVSYTSAGENIAMGQKTPADVVRDWMNSSGHRANIMNPKFTHIGIGYIKGTKHSYWTQQFISK